MHPFSSLPIRLPLNHIIYKEILCYIIALLFSQKKPVATMFRVPTSLTKSPTSTHTTKKSVFIYHLIILGELRIATRVQYDAVSPASIIRFFLIQGQEPSETLFYLYSSVALCSISQVCMRKKLKDPALHSWQHTTQPDS